MQTVIFSRASIRELYLQIYEYSEKRSRFVLGIYLAVTVNNDGEKCDRYQNGYQAVAYGIANTNRTVFPRAFVIRAVNNGNECR